MIENEVTKSWKYKLIKLKYYFDTGNAMMSLPSKVAVVVGISGAVKGIATSMIFILGLSYALFLFALGICYIELGFLRCEEEVRNQYNQFVVEVRKRKNI